MPTLKALAATRRQWDPLPITIDGRQVSPRVCGLTALWYGALRDQPVRIIVVRDPSGRRRDEAFFCTDRRAEAAFILEAYARRGPWRSVCTVTSNPWGSKTRGTRPSGRWRTAPLAGRAYDLVLLWAAQRAEQGLAPGWPVRPWYRSKTTPSFLDLLTALRQDSRPLLFSEAPYPPRHLNKPVHQPSGPLAAAA